MWQAKAKQPHPRRLKQAKIIQILQIQLQPSLFFSEDKRRTALDAVLTRDEAIAFASSGWRGYAPLCEAFPKILSRKFKTLPENMQIVSDIRQGFEIVADELISLGDAVILESLKGRQCLRHAGQKFWKCRLGKQALTWTNFLF